MQCVWPRALALILIWIASPGHSESWQQQSQADDLVQLWTQEDQAAKPRYQRVRAEITIDAPIGPLLPLLQDASTQQRWLPYTHKVRVLERPSQLQTRVQFITQSRWPFQPRDAITLFEIEPLGPDQIRINMINQPDSLPLEAGHLRIRTAEGHWLLTALESCTTRVQYQSGSRWGGMIPQWLVDSTNARLAKDALTALKPWAEQHYKDYTAYDFLPASTLHRTCH